MNVPSPRPIASRKNTGSKKPDSTMTQLVLLVALSPRATTDRALRAYSELIVALWVGSVVVVGHPARNLLTNTRRAMTQPTTASTTRIARCQPTGHASGGEP